MPRGQYLADRSPQFGLGDTTADPADRTAFQLFAAIHGGLEAFYGRLGLQLFQTTRAISAQIRIEIGADQKRGNVQGTIATSVVYVSTNYILSRSG
jgi:hypothetical protein